jgi:capsular polysaccharide biosynthesis protein
MLRLILRVLQRLQRPRWAQVFLDWWARLTKDPRAYRELAAVSLALGDRGAVVHACEALVALDPQDADGVWNLALFKLQSDTPAAAAPLFARHRALRTGILPEMRACRISLMDPARAARGEPYVATLEDVLVDTGYWSVIHGDRLYCRETHDRTISNAPFVSGRISRDGQVVIVSVAEPAATVEEPCVLLGGDDNYSHWLYRNLLKLSLLDHDPALAGLPMLVNDDLRRYQLEFLDLLQIPRERLLRVKRDTFVHCKLLVVPTVLRNHPRMRTGIDWIRGRLAGHLAPEADAHDLVYISRRDSPVRKLLNDEELALRLEAEGFRTLVASELSVAEQIRAFSRARVIVGPHGAGLTNLVFAPREALVVEIVSTAIAHMEEFRAIARHMGQRLVTLVSDDLGDEAPHLNPMHRDFRADIPEVLATLRRERPGLVSA